MTNTRPTGSSIWDVPGTEGRTYPVTAAPRLTPEARAVLARRALDPATRDAIASVPVVPQEVAS